MITLEAILWLEKNFKEVAQISNSLNIDRSYVLYQLQCPDLFQGRFDGGIEKTH